MRARIAYPLLALLVAALAGVWFDLLPGGWRLRRMLLDPRAQQLERDARHRAERIADFALEPTPPTAVVFLGSSTIERFDLAAAFPGRPALNRGIGNEALDLLRERWRASVPADAAGLVLYLGSVDLRQRLRSAEDFALALRALLRELRARHPTADVVVLGLLPERGMTAESARELAAFNAALELGAREIEAHFLPTDRAPLRAADGSLSEAFSSDRLHLSDEGYAVLSRWILDSERPIATMLRP